MKTIFTLQHAGYAKVGTRVFCKKCAKESPFFRGKCMECGTAYAKRAPGTGTRWTFADSRKHAFRVAAVRDDRAAYWKRQAEESRAKFEGVTAKPKTP